MKHITITLALLLTITTSWADKFTPSHRLAAQLRFEAIRAGEAFEDWTAPGPTREEFIEARDARTKARRDSLMDAYAKELRDSQPQKSEQETLMQRIKALEAKLLDQNQSTVNEEANNTSTQSDTQEHWNAIDTTDGKLIAGVSGLAGMGLAGMAGMGYIRRKKTNSETTPDLDTGFDS